MEVPHTILCLYSKFSNSSKNFLDLVNSNGIDYITPVCVDNKEIRNKIISSSYQIQYVPCLLFIYASGSIEKYEGDLAFKWLNEIINKKMIENQKLQQEMVQSVQQTPIISKKSKKSKKVIEEPEEDEESSSEEEEPEPPKKTKKNKVVRVSEQTDLNDLLDLGETVQTETNVKQSIKDGGNIMNKVQEMQRMREAEDAKLSKKPF
jgi:hypothetical protein